MGERGKGFPRLSLASAIQIIETAAKFGKTWPKEQFAGFGSKSGAGSSRSGAFAARVSSLKEYGLIGTDKDKIHITDLGTKIAKPVTTEERDNAIKQAFLTVDTFRQLYEHFDSDLILNTDQVSEHAVYNVGISRESKDRFINSFVDSGKYVKLIEENKENSTITLRKNDSVQNVSKTKDNLVNLTSESVQKKGLSYQFPDTQTSNINLDASPEGKATGILSEQGVNHSGRGWSLVVILKTSRRFSAETRRNIRNLLEKADELSDELHTLEQSDTPNNEEV